MKRKGLKITKKGRTGLRVELKGRAIEVYSGKYVDLVEGFSEGAENLRIWLRPEGKKFLEGKRMGDTWPAGTDAVFRELLASHMKAGPWEFVKPEDISALTSSPLLSRDRAGGKIYWFPNCQIECEVETLLEKGEVVFHLGPAN